MASGQETQLGHALLAVVADQHAMLRQQISCASNRKGTVCCQACSHNVSSLREAWSKLDAVHAALRVVGDGRSDRTECLVGAKPQNRLDSVSGMQHQHSHNGNAS